MLWVKEIYDSFLVLKEHNKPVPKWTEDDIFLL